MKRVTVIDAHVGKQLKLRRINLGMSQQELGKLLNMKFQQVQKYEKGINRLSAGKLYEISKILNTPFTYFFQNLENPIELIKNNFEYNDLSKEILVITRLLNKIKNKEKRRNFIDTIKNLIKFMG